LETTLETTVLQTSTHSTHWCEPQAHARYSFSLVTTLVSGTLVTSIRHAYSPKRNGVLRCQPRCQSASWQPACKPATARASACSSAQSQRAFLCVLACVLGFAYCPLGLDTTLDTSALDTSARWSAMWWSATSSTQSAQSPATPAQGRSACHPARGGQPLEQVDRRHQLTAHVRRRAISAQCQHLSSFRVCDLAKTLRKFQVFSGGGGRMCGSLNTDVPLSFADTLMSAAWQLLATFRATSHLA